MTKIIVVPQDCSSCKVVFSVEHNNAKVMFYSHRKGTLLHNSARISPWAEGLTKIIKEEAINDY